MPIPWKLNVTLFGKRIFAGIVKLRVLKWGHPGLPVCTLNQLTSFLVRHRGDRHKKRMCDSRGRDRNMFSNKKHLEPLEAGWSKKDLILENLEEE